MYVKETDLEQMLQARSIKSFVSKMIDKIYTREVLKNATPSGFPPRGNGRSSYKSKPIPPMTHPDGISALIGKVSKMYYKCNMNLFLLLKFIINIFFI